MTAYLFEKGSWLNRSVVTVKAKLSLAGNEEKKLELSQKIKNPKLWSLGNEAGHGDNFYIMADHIRELDSTRPIQYRQMNEAADMDSRTYPTPDWLIQRPKTNQTVLF